MAAPGRYNGVPQRAAAAAANQIDLDQFRRGGIRLRCFFDVHTIRIEN
jgi:hypothetical protein